MTIVEKPEALLEHWFSPAVRPLWFNATAEFDAELRQRYLPTYQAALAGQLAAWEETPRGALALVICLDQLPLNMFRGQPESFAGEAPSREVAERAIERGFDQSLQDVEKAFLYLPYMHSESLADQERSLALFTAAGLTDNLRWARHHCEIVRRFGRFPHRNAILGRESSTEERAWLASDEAFQG
jgi:uncharacterized protein (DUF924 family)